MHLGSGHGKKKGIPPGFLQLCLPPLLRTALLYSNPALCLPPLLRTALLYSNPALHPTLHNHLALLPIHILPPILPRMDGCAPAYQQDTEGGRDMLWNVFVRSKAQALLLSF